MNTDHKNYYLNLDTQERVRAVYTVHLIMPATYGGMVDVEAESEEEAAQLALDTHLHEVKWEFDGSDEGAAEVWDVECEEPPEDGVFIQRTLTSNATLDGLFEPVPSVVPNQEETLFKGYRALMQGLSDLGASQEDIATVKAVVRPYSEGVLHLITDQDHSSEEGPCK